ncbi:hypothetical protein EV424DRAFT_1321185 [Suillus variegatus]|nr:hypothetical protein EV424DRAFT_1321185 [Suillus variegatus]
MKWQAACRFVEQQSHGLEPSCSVASVFQMQLSMLPWEGDVCGFMDYLPIHNLAQFASWGWLCDNNINFALELIHQQIKSSNVLAPFHDILQTYFINKLRTVFELHHQQDYFSADDCLHLRQVGQDVANGIKTVGMACFVHSNHWLSLVIDGSRHTIYFGDSFGHKAPDSIHHAVEWWLGLHTPISFKWNTLACTHQQDQYSCGILAVNAIAHHFLLQAYSLLISTHDELDAARMQIGIAIIDVHLHALSVSINY